MSEPRAILVDDDPQQLVEASSALSEAGFRVSTFVDAQSILDFLDGPMEFVDLFVLDRKLPMKTGEVNTDELGDALFTAVALKYPDARILVFSGYTDFDHAQSAVEGSGLVYEQGKVRLDRVTVLRKSQFDQFDRHVHELRAAIRTLENIDLNTDSPVHPDEVQKRVLRRVGSHYSAASIDAKLLAGGLTDAKVWQCDITTQDGSIAHVVAKQSRKTASPGGLQDVLAREHIARRVEVVGGLMGGYVVSILQLAGPDPSPLLDFLPGDDQAAATQARALAAVLDSLTRSARTNKALSEMTEPFIEWPDLESKLVEFGVRVPDSKMWVGTSTILSHGDLHPANVLICNDKPVIIDSDGNSFASCLVDPVTLLVSTLVHPDSAIGGGRWPTPSEIEAQFGERTFGANSECPRWFAAIHDWIGARQTSEREFWSVVLAFSVRQLGYPDVLSSPDVRDRVLAIVQKSSRRLVDG